MANEELWAECLCESMAEHGIAATPEQLTALARDAARIAESMQEHTFRPEHPAVAREKELSAELKFEREKEVCPACLGRGRIYGRAGPWYTNEHCSTCNGEGKVHPTRMRRRA